MVLCIVFTGLDGHIAVGLTPKSYPLDHQPGWEQDSVAFHAYDGHLYVGGGFGQPLGNVCKIGDRIGCGVKVGKGVGYNFV